MRFLQRLARTLVGSAVRSVRNTFQYEGPAIGAFIKRQFAPPPPPRPVRPAQTKTARPKAAVQKGETPKAPRRPSIDQRIVELEALKRQINETASLEEYQQLYVRYRALLAELATASTRAAATKVKAHKRDGHAVRSHKRRASKVGSGRERGAGS